LIPIERVVKDLSKSSRGRFRVLLVNDQRPLLEEMEQILVTSSCEVRSSSKADAILIADAFLEPERYGCWPMEFKAQFAMLGHTLPPTLGTELYVNLNPFPVDNRGQSEAFALG
jgi:hypothetical protein